MRPVEVSQEEVVQAGLDLQAVGRNVTGFALRQKVGGGNANRLKQVWDEYVASKAVAQISPVAELPVEVAEEMSAVTRELTDRLTKLAVELNDKTVKASERRVSEVVRAAGEQREQAERELVDAALTVDELESKLESAQAELVRSGQVIEGLNRQSQAQEVELAQLRERLVSMEQHARALVEQHAAEAAKAARQIASLERTVEQVRTELTEVRVRAAADAQANDERKVAAEQEIARLADEARKLQGTLDLAQHELLEVRGSAALLRNELTEVTVRAAAEAKAAERAMSRLGEDVHKLQESLGLAQREVLEAKEVNAKLTGRMEGLVAQNEALLAAIKPGSGQSGSGLGS